MINHAHGAGGEGVYADVEAEELGEKHPVVRRAGLSFEFHFLANTTCNTIASN
jgi:hypothetical protein